MVRLEQAIQVFQCKLNPIALRAIFEEAEVKTAINTPTNKLTAPTGVAVVAFNHGTITGSRGKDSDVISRFFTV